MPEWNRKIGQSPLEQDAYNIAKLLEQVKTGFAGCCPTTTTTTTSSSTTTTTTTQLR